MIYQCWFTNYNKCNTLVGDVDNGRGNASVGQSVYGKFLYFPLNFAMNFKLF